MKQFLRKSVTLAFMRESKPIEDVEIAPVFPMRINKYLAMKKHGSRREVDEFIKEGKIFLNGRLAVLGDKVKEGDLVEYKFSGKQHKK
jgi:ribosomal 50S subunit-recycling heat shock protein